MRYLIAMIVLVLAAIASDSARSEILIGVAGPMTGKDAWYGEQMQRGAEQAAADLNAAGGVLGQQVRLIAADDVCDPEQAVAAARKLVGDGVVLVVGHFCSSASIPASAVYEAASVVMISPASTNPVLTEQGRANVFRVTGRDDVQGVVAGDYLANHWHGKKIAIFNDNSIFGKRLADETKRQLNKRGVAEAIYQSFTPAKSDYSSEIAALHAADIAVLYVGGYHTEIALLARAAYDRHYALQLVAGDVLQTEEFGLIAGPAADGALFTFRADPRRNPEAASVVERFRAGNFEPEGYTLISYGAVQAWAQAVEQAGSLKLEAVVASLRSHQFDTVLGRIAFDGKGDLTSFSSIWYVWKAGKYVPVE
jgi:branched-chain amino acid transport system substrate-binding protein